ncbi:exo-alpha-sialidase [Thermoleophilia bacterium SCSIO 60948]|nr:exo-alpha-sialidase [Thermoleophilia bacterium SCSIO 60948]
MGETGDRAIAIMQARLTELISERRELERALATVPGKRGGPSRKRRGSGASRRRPRAIGLVANARCLLPFVAAITVALPVGCGEGATDSGTASAPDFEHIHGLGVNPADGDLFIATHNGVFSAADDETTPLPVGPQQDVMGFSVVGPDRFIGSGHPGPGQDLPTNLGLIESRDAGETWENIALLGDVDFHVLESAGAKVYGFDGARSLLLVSNDGGETWEEREPPAPMFDLVIDPRDSESIVAATEEGLFSSSDAGTSWSFLGRDPLGLLAWTSEDSLYTIDADGATHRSADGGTQWKVVGDAGGQPAAFVAGQRELFAALADNTVQRSTDGGATWTERVAP